MLHNFFAKKFSSNRAPHKPVDRGHEKSNEKPGKSAESASSPTPRAQQGSGATNAHGLPARPEGSRSSRRPGDHPRRKFGQSGGGGRPQGGPRSDRRDDNREFNSEFKRDFNQNSSRRPGPGPRDAGRGSRDDRSFYGDRPRGNGGGQRSGHSGSNSQQSYDFSGGDKNFQQAPLRGDVKFSELNLPKEVLLALDEMNISTMTPIQERSIPSLIEGRDLVGCSQTGSGKTAAFLVPILVRLLEDPSKNALILTPTRELADQVHEVAVTLSQHLLNFRCSLIVGGGRMGRQLQALKKSPRIVVATPGRLLDHLFNHALNLKNSSIVVLDEADRMLDMGFAPQIDKIFKTLASERQTMLFSATFSKEVTRLIEQNTKNPVRVKVESTATSKPQIKEIFMDVNPAEKNRVLTEELGKRQGSVLIFVKTQARVDKVAKGLKQDGYKVESIHGGRTQGQRKRAMENFKSGEYPVLVATDIAARGLDVNDVGYVINYDPPQQLEDYIHRIGRTARAGKTGEALSLVCAMERNLWAPIKRRAQKN